MIDQPTIGKFTDVAACINRLSSELGFTTDTTTSNGSLLIHVQNPRLRRKDKQVTRFILDGNPGTYFADSILGPNPAYQKRKSNLEVLASNVRDYLVEQGMSEDKSLQPYLVYRVSDI